MREDIQQRLALAEQWESKLQQREARRTAMMDMGVHTLGSRTLGTQESTPRSSYPNTPRGAYNEMFDGQLCLMMHMGLLEG